MARTELDPSKFEAHHLWREAIALGQELPIVPGKSIMYIGQLSIVKAGPNSLLVAPFVRWADRADNSVDFSEGSIRGEEASLWPTFASIRGAMGSVDNARAERGYLKDNDCWASPRPSEQEAHARDFAQRARRIQIIPGGDRYSAMQARVDAHPDQKAVLNLATINLHLARLVGDEDTSFYEGVVTRAEQWDARENLPSTISWLLPPPIEN